MILYQKHMLRFGICTKYTIEELKRSPIIKSFNTEDHLYIENMHNWNENETARFWKKYYEEIIKKVNIKNICS